MYFSAFVFVCTCLAISYAGATCEKDGQSFQTGDTYSRPGECVKYTCQGDGELTGLACAVIRVSEGSGWTLTSDPSLPYPGCCPRAVPPPARARRGLLPDQLPCVVDGKEIPVGQQYDAPGACGLNLCKGNNEWTQAACGMVGVREGGIVIPEDPSKPFPECCAKAVPPAVI